MKSSGWKVVNDVAPYTVSERGHETPLRSQTSSARHFSHGSSADGAQLYRLH
jgi:hypothetical protein